MGGNITISRGAMLSANVAENVCARSAHRRARPCVVHKALHVDGTGMQHVSLAM